MFDWDQLSFPRPIVDRQLVVMYSSDLIFLAQLELNND